MNLATWNLDHGRAAAAWPVLQQSQGADLLFLQECPDPRVPEAAWQATPREWRRTTPWGSAVIPARGRIETVEVDGYTGWVVGGRVVDSGLDRDGRPLIALSIHAPTGSGAEPRDSYVEEVGKILEHIDRRWPKETVDVILAGDFNFRSLGERQSGEALETREGERKALAQFAALGLVSCWTTAHPSAPLPQTLRWSGDRTEGKTTPYHCDGIFVPRAWAAGVKCEVLSAAKYTQASDHAPVVASLVRPAVN